MGSEAARTSRIIRPGRIPISARRISLLAFCCSAAFSLAIFGATPSMALAAVVPAADETCRPTPFSFRSPLIAPIASGKAIGAGLHAALPQKGWHWPKLSQARGLYRKAVQPCHAPKENVMAKMDPGADEKWSGQEKTKNTPSTNDATKGEPARDSNVAPDGAGGSRLPSGEDKGLNPGQRGPAQPTGTGPSGTAP